MAPGVFGQVVAAHEAPVAHSADELLLARVRSAVAGQLIGAGKLFVAAVPVTAERLLTCRRRKQDRQDTEKPDGPGTALTAWKKDSFSLFCFQFLTNNKNVN